jgi:hypothetical protein
MKGCLRGCLGSLGLGVVVLAAAWGGWRWGPDVFPRLGEWVGAATSTPEAPDRVPSAGLAEATLDRVEAFRAPEGVGDRLELDGVELSSVIRYALPGIIPPGVDSPGVEVEAGKVYLSARVAIAAFPDLPAVDEIVGLLPDTVDIELRGTVVPFGDGVSALHVERVEAERIPLPSRIIPGILRALGRRDRDGLPPGSMAVPLPTGLDRAFVEGDRLVLQIDR